MTTKIDFNPAGMFASATEAFNENSEKMKEAFGTSQSFGTDQFSAISKAVLDLTEANMNEAFTAVRKTVEAKDPTEAFEIQQDLYKTVGERTAEESKKIFDLTAEAATKSVEPFNAAATKATAPKAKKAA